MDSGFIVDKADGSMPSIGSWFSGVPEKAWWGGLKTKGRERREMVTWRCRRCGYLESYAGANLAK
jgi:hypothetical protein